MNMHTLPKLQPGDTVAIVSPSFAAPGQWPEVYELGRTRLKEIFGLESVEFPATKKVGASGEERAADLIAAFEDSSVKAVIASLGGNDQVTYIKNLPSEPFVSNPKPFFGFSDNTHFCNFLFLNGIPSYYGASLFTQFAMAKEMDEYSIKYLKHALFDEGEFELRPADYLIDSNESETAEVLVDWNHPETLKLGRKRYPNEGWYWDGVENANGLLWGGCLESIDELLRHGTTIPTLEQFEEIVLMFETSEEMPTAENVHRVLRALGERGVLERVRGVLHGRPKAWEFNSRYRHTEAEQITHRAEQREVVLKTIRQYNQIIPVVQNLEFGHTDPQIPMPYGGKVRIDAGQKKIFATF